MIDIQWLVTLSPLATLIGNVTTQLICMHLFHRFGLSIILGVITGLIIDLTWLGSLLLTNALPFEDYLISLLTYLALSFCYWAFLNLNITSLRVRLLRELLNKQENGLTTENLLQLYSPQELINRRIKRLEEAGQIVMRENKWVINSRILLVFVFVTSQLRKLIIPSKSEYSSQHLRK